MKKITLALFAMVGTIGSMIAQPNITIQAPFANTSSQLRAPNGWAEHQYLSGIYLIKASELAALTGSNVTGFGFSISNGTGTLAVTGNFTIHLQNTNDLTNTKGTNYAAATATIPTNYVGPMTVPISNTPTTIPFTLTNAFTYTGGGIYVCYQFSSAGPFDAAQPATYDASNIGTGNALGSTGYSSVSLTAANTMTVSDFRPAFLFTAVNTATNELGITRIVAPGKVSKLMSAHTITASVRNSSIGAKNNVVVALGVSGANTFADTKTVSTIAAGAVATVTFNVFTPTATGLNNMTVSILPDQNNNNNSMNWTQSVTCTEAGWVPPVAGSAFSTGNAYGVGTSAGFIYSTKIFPANTVSLSAVRLAVANFTANNIGKPIYPVLMDGTTGAIIATGNTITTTAAMLGNWVNFKFPTPLPQLTGGTSYAVGMACGAPATSFFPISILANTIVPYFTVGNFYSSPIAGNSLVQQSGIDYFGIEAVYAFSNTAVSVAASKTVICNNKAPNTVQQSCTLTATGAAGMTYSWNTTATTSSIVVNPSITATSGVINYTVTGTDPTSGCVSEPAVITLSLQNCSGVADNGDFGAEIKLYPNPSVNGKSTINGLNGTNVITVYNMIGQAVLTSKTSEESISIDLSGQAAGTYLVKITNEAAQSKTIKLVN